MGIVNLKILAMIGKRLPFPRRQHNIQSFLKAPPAFRVRHPINIIGPGKGAAPNAEVKAALGNLIHRSHFLGKPQRVLQR